MTTLQQTRSFLSRRLHVEERDLTPDRTLESLGIDSLAALELLFDLEDELGIRFPDGEPRMVTLGDLVARIDRELAMRPARAAERALAAS